jgi:hypothetical protein
LAGDRGFPYGLNEKTLNRVITLFTEIVMARETRDRPFRLPPKRGRHPPAASALCRNRFCYFRSQRLFIIKEVE